MTYDHDPRTGRLTLIAPAALAAAGITVERKAGCSWHAGKWPARVYNPSPAMVVASFFHDGRYDDAPWDAPSLARADRGFVEVYVREGGHPIIATLCWLALRGWSIWTVWRRVKPL